MVSLVLESFQGIQGANITFPSNLSIRLYSEVDISRWSAGKFIFARENKIVSGYKNGTFKPTQPVTRIELIGALPRAAEFRLSAGMQPNLVAKEPSKTFSDTENYGAASITQMSSYCLFAAAINEMGGLLSMILQSRITRLLLCGC